VAWVTWILICMTIRLGACCVECGMFPLVNEGKHGRHDNNWFGSMIKCVHYDLIIVLWLDNRICAMICTYCAIGVP